MKLAKTFSLLVSTNIKRWFMSVNPKPIRKGRKFDDDRAYEEWLEEQDRLAQALSEAERHGYIEEEWYEWQKSKED